MGVIASVVDSGWRIDSLLAAAIIGVALELVRQILKPAKRGVRRRISVRRRNARRQFSLALATPLAIVAAYALASLVNDAANRPTAQTATEQTPTSNVALIPSTFDPERQPAVLIPSTVEPIQHHVAPTPTTVEHEQLPPQTEQEDAAESEELDVLDYESTRALINLFRADATAQPTARPASDQTPTPTDDPTPANVEPEMSVRTYATPNGVRRVTPIPPGREWLTPDELAERERNGRFR